MFSFHFLNIWKYLSLGNPFLINRTGHIFQLSAPRFRNIGAPDSGSNKRFAELSIKKHGITGFPVAIAPTASFRGTFHPPLNGMVVNYFNVLIC